MASLAKKRALEMVTNGEKSDNSSDESIGDEEDSVEDSEDSDEEINEVNSEVLLCLMRGLAACLFRMCLCVCVCVCDCFYRVA